MARLLHITMLSTECFPFVKVGGLADVVSSLSGELGRRGHRVDVVIPAFRAIQKEAWGFEPLELPTTRQPGPEAVWRARSPESGVNTYLVGGNSFFDRAGVYVDEVSRAEFPDQLERWIYFQRAALALIEALPETPDVIHYHDHHTGLVPAYLEAVFRASGPLSHPATVGTIHNLAYQGVFDGGMWSLLDLGNGPAPAPFAEYYGGINLMKAGIMRGDVLTTVSPTYAREIQTPEFGFGLDGCVRDRSDDLFGILNGVDLEVWNPARDPEVVPYSIEDMSGKGANRERLLAEFDLDSGLHDGPILAMISRIEEQKGFDILLPILDALLGEDVYFVLLGKGNPVLETRLRAVVEGHPDRARARIDVDEGLAHRLEAGADIFLMPSRYEPSGLNQMYSMIYGTVPVVRATGGLADTVSEFDPATGEGTGFRFASLDPADFRSAIDRALALWKDKEAWQRVQANGMRMDFSWSGSADRYTEVYRRALAGRGTRG